MKRFEYHIFHLDLKGVFFGGGIHKADLLTMDDQINDLGMDGWELVSSVNTNGHTGTQGVGTILLLFKRELTS